MPSVTLAPLLPMVKPLIVTTKGDVPITAADVVKTTEVKPGLLQVTIRPAVLVAPAWTYGVDIAKKLGG